MCKNQVHSSKLQKREKKNKRKKGSGDFCKTLETFWIGCGMVYGVHNVHNSIPSLRQDQ